MKSNMNKKIVTDRITSKKTIKISRNNIFLISLTLITLIIMSMIIVLSRLHIKGNVDAKYSAIISEKNNSSDAKIYPDIPYFDFGFNINDILIYDENISEIAFNNEIIYKLKNDLNVNNKLTVYKDGTQFCVKTLYPEDYEIADDSEFQWYESDNGVESLIIDGVDKKITYYGPSVHYTKTEYSTEIGRSFLNKYDNALNTIINPVVPSFETLTEVYNSMHIHELDLISEKMGSNYEYNNGWFISEFNIRCNWSDDIYKVIKSINNYGTVTYVIANNANNVYFKFSLPTEKNNKWAIGYTYDN